MSSPRALMRLCTWNVNSLPARLDFVLDFLQTHQPDVVCLQELKVEDEAFPHLAFAQLGYVALTHGQPQWNGVAVLVRRALDSQPRIVQRGLPGAESYGARLLTVAVAGISVSSVYVPNGKSMSHPDFKLKLAVMAPLAIWAWLMHFTDLSFNIMPTLHPDGFVIHWLDLACMAFMGGVCALVFLRSFRAHPPFPQKDPRMAECLGIHLPPSKSSPGGAH